MSGIGPIRRDIDIYIGQNWFPRPIILVDIKGAVINLAGRSVRAEIREERDKASLLIMRLDESNGRVTLVDAEGKVTYGLNAGSTAQIPVITSKTEAWWALELYHETTLTDITGIFYGQARFHPDQIAG